MRNGQMAVCSGDNTVRIWDLSNDDNCALHLHPAKAYAQNDAIHIMAYCQQRRELNWCLK